MARHERGGGRAIKTTGEEFPKGYGLAALTDVAAE